MKRSEVSRLPEGSALPTFLYAAARSDGVIKIGSTRNPRTRMGALFNRFKNSGLAMEGAYLVETSRPQFKAERDALAAMKRRGAHVVTGREWFAGVSNGAAMAALDEAAAAPADPAQETAS